MLTDVLSYEGFKIAESCSSTGIGFGNNRDNGGYSGEAREDVDIKRVETIGEGIMVVRRGGVDHIEGAVNMRIQMFLGTLYFCFLLSISEAIIWSGEKPLQTFLQICR